VAGVGYAEVVDENKRGEGEDGKVSGYGWRMFADMKVFLDGGRNPFVDVGGRDGGDNKEKEVLREFLTLLAACRTVIPEVKDVKTKFQASSRD